MSVVTTGLDAIECSPLQLSSPRIVAAAYPEAEAASSRSFDLGSGWLTVSLELEEARA